MKQKRIIGYTTGVFDLFHIGHLNILRKASADCDSLLVGVTTDELCHFRKNKFPIIPYKERAEIIRSLKFVDRVVPQKDMDKLQAWERYKFHKIYVGDDWKGSARWNRYEDQFQSVGVQVIYLPYTNHVSSTILREKISENNSEKKVANLSI